MALSSPTTRTLLPGVTYRSERQKHYKFLDELLEVKLQNNFVFYLQMIFHH